MTAEEIAKVEAIVNEEIQRSLPDGTGIGYVGTAAKLGREIAHLNDADYFSVLFSKQRHSARLFCIL